MSAHLYDEWAEQCCIGRDQTVIVGTKRKRKKSSKYADTDKANNAEPSTINATINKRKTLEKSIDASSLPTSPHPAMSTPITMTSPSKTNTPPDAILPEEVNFPLLQSFASASLHHDTEDAKEDNAYSGDCNVTKEQFFKYRCGVAGTKVTAKEPLEELGRVENSHLFLRAVDLAA
eukprot:15333579-Ditylum_brightwellii.AAC.1